MREKGGGHAGGLLREYTPTVNSLNQLTSLTVPSRQQVLGASSASEIRVNGTPATRQGERYGIELPIDNSTGAQRVPIAVTDPDTGESLSTHRDLQASTQSYSYDLDGNLTHDGVWSYKWDGENRLSSAEYQLATSDAEKRKLSYLYDHQSRRILKRELHWNSTKSGWYAQRQTKYLYDDWNVVAEVLNETTLSKTYTWGTDLSGTAQGAGGVGGLLATTDHLNNYQAAYTYDGNGNVTALVEKGTNTLLAEYEYTAFGETLTAKGPQAQNNPYRFSTKPLEKETGHYYYGYRYYNPKDGRWLNRDPIEEQGGVNLYGMVANNIINTWDVLGNISADMPTLDFLTTGASVAVTGCFPLPGGFGLCFSGGVSIQTGKCSDGSTMRSYVSRTGNYRIFARWPSLSPISVRVRQPIVQDIPCCPDEEDNLSSSFFVRVTASIGYADCHYKGGWSCTAGITFNLLKASNSFGGFNIDAGGSWTRSTVKVN